MESERYGLTERGKTVFARGFPGRTLWEKKVMLMMYGDADVTPSEIYNAHRGEWYGSPHNRLTEEVIKKLLKGLIEDNLVEIR